MKEQTTLGLIVGNRGFFPGHLCEQGRVEMIHVMEEEGFKVIALLPDATEYGSVESLEDAHKCANLFKQHAGEIDGVVVTLPNFGDERAVANTLRFSGLNVPVLIQAYPDEVGKMDIANRRDSFCGKLSVCNNLHQYGIPYSLTRKHTVRPDSDGFRADLDRFGAICRVAGGLRRARFGMLGARTTAFNTVRFSEKLLERAGISVETLDLSEAIGRADKLRDGDADVKAKRAQIEAYAQTAHVPGAALDRMARFGVVIDRWMAENELVATAMQCWSSIEEHFGIIPCTLMSIMSNLLAPSACETDIAGATGMYALALASGKPSALVDWNNNYGDDPDKGVLFHCSNWPADVLIEDVPVMSYNTILANTLPQENTYGTLFGRAKPEPFTYCRVETDDFNGRITAYVGEGRFTDDPLDSFGGLGVVEIPHFQDLLYHLSESGYEHHVAVNLSLAADAVAEAFNKYLGWQTYYHK
ncbi:MAG: L-fucose/L-arabinose isomerase family protein [Anaerolineae bacterium]|nr:L-fucose/L-arabinose isomerase family protein [Anaerolineae bacterium]